MSTCPRVRGKKERLGACLSSTTTCKGLEEQRLVEDVSLGRSKRDGEREGVVVDEGLVIGRLQS